MAQRKQPPAMPHHLRQLLLTKTRLTVGAITDPTALRPKISRSECDLIELRLDVLGNGAAVQEFVATPGRPHPLLLTARHPAEGGGGELSSAKRAALLREFLPHGAALDVELRSLEELTELADLWAEAGTLGLVRVASFHNFERTPDLAELRAHIAAAASKGAEVAKLAFRIKAPADLITLIALFDKLSPLPLSVMGMGPLAPSSRLLAAQLGSVLNYGYLGNQPTAPGQWPAPLLKQALTASSTPGTPAE